MVFWSAHPSAALCVSLRLCGEDGCSPQRRRDTQRAAERGKKSTAHTDRAQSRKKRVSISDSGHHDFECRTVCRYSNLGHFQIRRRPDLAVHQSDHLFAGHPVDFFLVFADPGLGPGPDRSPVPGPCHPCSGDRRPSFCHLPCSLSSHVRWLMTADG